LANETDFKYIVRVADTDLPGEGKLVKTLPKIRGIGARAALALVRSIKLDPNKIVGELEDKEVDLLNESVKKIDEHLPGWMLNRRKDYETGEDVHFVSIDISTKVEDDINRMKKIKSYKGVRHQSGHKVRGQRTYSNGRRGLALGVSKGKK
tara:strand:- start:590 stop:1042 length:453 start_codon:yes stop_codon:yes gene_type:complete